MQELKNLLEYTQVQYEYYKEEMMHVSFDQKDYYEGKREAYYDMIQEIESKIKIHEKSNTK